MHEHEEFPGVVGPVVKCRSVMELNGVHMGKAIFAQEVVEEAHVYQVQMAERSWDGMGRPTTITVSVEPGDRLNDEEEVGMVVSDGA